MIPKKPTPAERDYKQSKEETDVLRNQRDESARKGEEHLRVVEQQRVVRQAAQERLDAIRVERRKMESEYNSAIAAIEEEILASNETSAEAERGVKLERQKTRETEDLLTRRRVEREQSRASLVMEDDSRLPKATPEPYDPENPTLTVTLSRGPRAPTVGAVMGESGVNLSKFEAFQELRRLYPGSSRFVIEEFLGLECTPDTVGEGSGTKRGGVESRSGGDPSIGPGGGRSGYSAEGGDTRQYHGRRGGDSDDVAGTGGGGIGGNGGDGGHRDEGHHGHTKAQQQDGGRGDSGWGGRGNSGGGGFHGQRGGHRDNSNYRSRNRYEVESSLSDEEGQRDRHASTTTTDGRATVRNGGRGGDSATNTHSIKRAYARFDTNVLIAFLPLPTVDDSLADLGGAQVFSTMDLVSGFFQCSIHEDSIPLTAVCTQSGNWEWTVMPMGLASSPGWFQSIMLRVCEGLERVRLFIDDIVCFSKNGGEHVNDFRKFLERLTNFNLKLAPKKAHLGVKVVKFLGHRITAEGIAQDPGK